MAKKQRERLDDLQRRIVYRVFCGVRAVEGMLNERTCTREKASNTEVQIDVPSVCVQAHASLVTYRCYLVDPASSHMLVSKIKPCRSKSMPY